MLIFLIIMLCLFFAIAAIVDDVWWRNIMWVLVVVGLIWGGIKLNESQCGIDASYSVPLYSGHNANKLHGSFFLMGGQIDEVDTVYYWVQSGNTLRKYSNPMWSSSFIEDGENYLLIKQTKCTSNWFFDNSGNPTTYEFHVPEGSVANMYNFQ
jgi:hypothetical protein